MMAAKYYAHYGSAGYLAVCGDLEKALKDSMCPEHGEGRPLVADDFKKIDAREFYGTAYDLVYGDGEWHQ